MTSRLRRRIAIPVLLTYTVLSVSGAWFHVSRLSIAALVLLLTAFAVLTMHWQRPLTIAIWLLFAVPLLGAVLTGHAPLALDAVPIVVNAGLAWLFGHTLVAGEQPLIARMIAIIEEPHRLELPGVAHYARQLTLFWALLLAAQALLLLVLVMCVVPGGVLTSLGFASPWPLAQTQVAWYTRVGTYLVPLAAMVLEYPWRRWALRHIPHLSAREFITRMIVCWPQLLRHREPPHE